MKTQAVILAAGLGTRLRPITYLVPKPMIRLNGRPILEYTLENLPKEIEDVIIVIHYLADQIKQYFGPKFGKRNIRYVFQPEPKGTADALFHCKEYLGNGKFLVCTADDLYHPDDLKRLLKHNFAILASEHSEPHRFGVLQTDQQGNLRDFKEKPRNYFGNLVNTGAYVLRKEIFDYPRIKLENSQEDNLPLTIANAARKIPVKVEKAAFWLPVGLIEDLKKADEYLRNAGLV